jgi:hypothetical protein
VYREVGNLIESHPEHQQYFEPIQNIAQQYLGFGNAQHHMHYQSSHLATDVSQYNFPTEPIQNVERVPRRREYRDTYYDYSQAQENQNLNQNSNQNENFQNFDEDESFQSSQNHNISDEGPSTINQTGGSAFSQWSNPEGGMGFSQLAHQAGVASFSSWSNQAGGSGLSQFGNQDFYTPTPQNLSLQATGQYSNDFFNLIVGQNDDEGTNNYRPRHNVVTPIPYRNIQENESTSEVQLDDDGQRVRRGHRQRVSRRCGTGSRIGPGHEH